MANSPLWKIYSGEKEYVASCKYAEDAAALVALYGNGATVRYHHSTVVWSEGSESQSAAESYSSAALVMHDRIKAKMRSTYDKQYGKQSVDVDGVVSVPGFGQLTV